MLIIYLSIKKLPVPFYQSDDRTLPDSRRVPGGSRKHCGYIQPQQTGTVRPTRHCTALSLCSSHTKCDSTAQQTNERGTLSSRCIGQYICFIFGSFDCIQLELKRRMHARPWGCCVRSSLGSSQMSCLCVRMHLHGPVAAGAPPGCFPDILWLE